MEIIYKPKFFTEDEFQKVSCSLADINPSSLQRLDLARSIARIPFVITSAYRRSEEEKQHNRTGSSAHCLGRAFDIRCVDSHSRFLIISAGIKAGFTRIGVGKNFIHLDDSPIHSQEVIWTYY